MFRFSPDGSQRLRKTMTSTPVALCINEALPEELLGVIFEEHAKLEWRAPVIDGQVCHQWRQTILRSPRAWSHLRIVQNFASAPSKLHQWLDRSSSVSLHIQLMGWIQGAEEALDPHCKRIKSITLWGGFFTFLKRQSFPVLQSLDVVAIFRRREVICWSAMPKLRSYRANNVSVDALPSNIFPPLRVLALSSVNNCDSIIINSSRSLVSLTLDHVSLQYTSEPLEFPSLTFLSLFEVTNIKHRITVLALTTYHESGRTEEESFSMSLPSLIEYGICRINTEPFFDVKKLHQCYPNISRLSLRAPPLTVKPFLHSLRDQPNALPMLRILVVGEVSTLMKYSGEDKDSMRKDAFMRNMASSVRMELCFDGKDRGPLCFAHVRVYTNDGRSKLTFTLRSQRFPIEDLSLVLSLWLPC